MVTVTVPENAILDNTIWVGHGRGTTILITDMKDEHLLSSIRMIERGHDYMGRTVPEWCKAKAPALVIEAGKRGILGDLKLRQRVAEGWDA